MKVNEWIKNARKAAGLTQEQFGDTLNRTKGNVSSWEKGAHEPSWSLMLKISDLSGEPLPIDFKYSPMAPKPNPDEYLIPRFDTGGKMGGTGLVLTGWAGAIENLKVDAEWLRKNLKGYTSTKNLGIITGFGESMEPLFKAGDPLIIDMSINEHVGDFPYFFRVGNEGYVKKLQKVPGRYIAISVNEDYLPFDITPDMDFSILGRVIKAWCSEDF